MKTIVTTILFVIALSTVSFAAPKNADSVHVISTKDYMFFFKVEKNMIGGTIEIIDSTGNSVEGEKIETTKNIVDFFYLPAGTYTIKITKGTEAYNFTYTNKE